MNAINQKVFEVLLPLIRTNFHEIVIGIDWNGLGRREIEFVEIY